MSGLKPIKQPSSKSKTVRIPWKSWYGNEQLELKFPATWQVTKEDMKGAKRLSEADIRSRIKNPIGTPSLKELARHKRSVCIAIDDMTRPTEVYKILPAVLEELKQAGVDENEIFILASLGTHRPLTRDDLVKKVGGSVVKRFRVYNHNCYENVKYIGDTSFGTPVHVNKFYLTADLKVGIGMIAPHTLAGFSGGGKLVFPGLCGIETIELNHAPKDLVIKGQIGNIRDNTRRQEIEEGAKMAGLDFIITTVQNAKGETAGIFTGHPDMSFRKAAESAREIYATQVKYDQEVAVFNAFPKDTELLQVLQALNIWATRDEDKALVKRGGTIVVITASSEGCGWHGLKSVGMRKFVRKDELVNFKKLMEGRQIFFLCPNVNAREFHDYFPDSVFLFHHWNGLLSWLEKTHGPETKASIYPSGPLQMDANLV